MNILVTGGAGYIGSVVTEILQRRGYKPFVVDNLSIGRRKYVPEDIPFFENDIADSDAIAKIIRDNHIDVVMHFAAFALVGESVENPEKYFTNNIEGTLNLLKGMKAGGCKRIIFFFFFAVYGNPVKDALDESHPKNPINPYGYSKLVMENCLDWYAQAYGFKYNIFRYFNAAGATALHGEDRDIETHILPILLQAAFKERDHFTIFGNDYNTNDGTCIRDYIHVEDLAEAHILGIENMNSHPRAIYNLGTGNGYSNLQVVNALKEITGMDFEVKYGERRPGDPDMLVAVATKANQELKWVPKHSDLKNIIETAFSWKNKLLEK
ncbi:MAG: UDP-glucose 4-epimerase GalE [Calditrichaeota bacterium]|nr:UDP-glucose 4-epimerase GalE [Calditrichota bacterium]